MNIIIAGDGEVGVHLAKSLSELDYNITVVDPHAELLSRLQGAGPIRELTAQPQNIDHLIAAMYRELDL